LVWIFNTIFAYEAKLFFRAHSKDWASLSFFERWHWGWSLGPRELWHTIRLIRPLCFALSLVFMGATIFLGVLRWRLVLQTQGLGLTTRRASRISLVAHFFNSFLLGSTGGDVMKAYYAARETHHKKAEAVVTVAVDRLIGLWSMLAFAGAMMIPSAGLVLRPGRFLLLSGVVLAMLGGSTLVLCLAFWGHGPIARWLAGPLRRFPQWAVIERSLSACRHFKSRTFLIKAVALSMALNLCCVMQLWVLSRGLGIVVSAWTLFAIVPMIISVSALPVTPSGLGVRESGFVLMLSAPSVDVNATAALSLSLLAYAGSLFWSLVGALVYMTAPDRRQIAADTREPAEQISPERVPVPGVEER
jgi:hypothetical protein